MYFQLLLKASSELSWLWEGLGVLSICRMGARRDTKGSVSVCAFPLSGHHKLCNSPRLNHGLTFNSGCEKVGTSWAWCSHLHIFFTRVLFPPFITWGLQKSICLCSINDFPNGKDILSGALEAEKIWVFEFSPGKSKAQPLFGVAALLLVQWAVGLEGSALGTHQRHLGCDCCVEAAVNRDVPLHSPVLSYSRHWALIENTDTGGIILIYLFGMRAASVLRWLLLC